MMSTMTTYGTLTTSSSGFSVSTVAGERPDTPKGLIVTRAVETVNGWLGQVIVDKAIVFETRAEATSDRALAEVNELVVNRIKRLFQPED